MKATTISRVHSGRRLVRWGLLILGILVLIPLGYYLYVVLWASNFHTVVPGQVYRSAAPLGDDIEDWCQDYGLKSIVDLRADGVSSTYPDEQTAADRAGAKLIYLRLSANKLPDGPMLRELIRVIETAPKPMLLHCQGGADRASLASFIAAMAIGGQDYRQAEKQFSIRYFQLQDDLPITRVLHLYRHWCRQQSVSTGGWQQFRHWAFDEYDKKQPA